MNTTTKEDEKKLYDMLYKTIRQLYTCSNTEEEEKLNSICNECFAAISKGDGFPSTLAGRINETRVGIKNIRQMAYHEVNREMLFFFAGLAEHQLKLAQDLLEMINSELLSVFHGLNGRTELAHLQKTVDNVLEDIG